MIIQLLLRTRYFPLTRDEWEVARDYQFTFGEKQCSEGGGGGGGDNNRACSQWPLYCNDDMMTCQTCH
jgi:hypothetical protein